MAAPARSASRTVRIPSRRSAPGLVHPDRAATRRRVPARVRRRLAALALLTLVAAAGFAAGVASATPAEAAHAAIGPDGAVVVLSAGETVWDLALPHTPPGTRPSEWVARVVAYNGVDPTTVRPGTPIRLPSPDP